MQGERFLSCSSKEWRVKNAPQFAGGARVSQVRTRVRPPKPHGRTCHYSHAQTLFFSLAKRGALWLKRAESSKTEARPAAPGCRLWTRSQNRRTLAVLFLQTYTSLPG